MAPVVKVTELDHLVLDVADVERSLAWYSDVLGLEPLRVDEWRRARSCSRRCGSLVDDHRPAPVGPVG